MIPTIPAKEWRLSKSGQVRCKVLAEKLESYRPDVIISSVEPKAIETAQIVAYRLNKPFRTFEGLHEHDRTGGDFLDKEQFEAKVNISLCIQIDWFWVKRQPTKQLKGSQKR